MHDTTRGGSSLWRDAWRRLRRNRFAMGGLVVVAVTSAAAAGASWIVPFEPDYGMPWIRAQPPGFEHPAVTAEIRFDAGEAPVVPGGVPPAVARTLEGDGEIAYLAHEIAETEYRVRVRRGKVESIQRLAGAERVAAI